MANTFTFTSSTTTRYYPAAEVRRVEPPPEDKGEMELMKWAVINQRGACGVGNIYDFGKINIRPYGSSDRQHYRDYLSKEGLHKNSGGCGFLSAAFIDTPECKAMYLKLKEWFPLLYQSPIRFNTNSGNNFFFAIFDTGEKEMLKRYSDPDHEDYDEYHESGFPNGLEW